MRESYRKGIKMTVDFDILGIDQLNMQIKFRGMSFALL